MSITRVGIDLLNVVLTYKVIGIIFTLLCIVFLIQAFNIIDGLNGLSLLTAILSFSALSIIAYETEAIYIFNFSTSIIFILFGVLIFNFPIARIFIGDSGSYIIGLYLALSLIILTENNLQISPFVVIQILIYPSYELFRSILRRFLIGHPILKPDNNHLHSILYKNCINKYSFNPQIINSISSIKIIFIQLVNFIYIINFYQNDILTILGIVIFVLTYEILYKRTKIKVQNY